MLGFEFGQVGVMVGAPVRVSVGDWLGEFDGASGPGGPRLFTLDPAEVAPKGQSSAH